MAPTPTGDWLGLSVRPARWESLTPSAAACAPADVEHVVLSGGVFQNRLMLTWTAERLDALGHTVLVPERLPANDGGISYGQAAVAAARMA